MSTQMYLKWILIFNVVIITLIILNGNIIISFKNDVISKAYDTKLINSSAFNFEILFKDKGYKHTITLIIIEEIKTDNNCIVISFENNPIAILQEDVENKKVYYFKASDIGKALGIVNIHSTIQNYEDEDERVIRKAYDPQKNLQDTSFLTSQGVYRLLYNSKKEIAKKFRKWAGNILDDIIFNESTELKKQLIEQ